MLDMLQLLPVAIGQNFFPQSLQRTPEQPDESAVMEGSESVNQYDLAMQSKLSIVYAGALEQVHRIKRIDCGGRAIDLCCGPGHFTLMLAKYFDFDEIVGVDLSEPMIEAARRNADQWGLSDRVKFVVGDATDAPFTKGEFDVVSCNDAAHHMPDLGIVQCLIREMERLAADNGVIMLTDLVRLKSERLTARYTEIIGRDYISRGLDSFQQDFCNSMRAAWTGNELVRAIPMASKKIWKHQVQKVLPTVQMLAATPGDGQAPYLRGGLPWTDETHPVPKELRHEWKLFRALIK